MPLRMPCIRASRLGKVSSIARPLLALSGHAWVHCTCLLLTQSGHRLALQSCTLNVFNFEQNSEGALSEDRRGCPGVPALHPIALDLYRITLGHSRRNSHEKLSANNLTQDRTQGRGRKRTSS